MVRLPGRNKKDPSIEKIIRMERTANIEARALDGHDSVMGARQIPDGIAFDYQAIEDENILRLFKDNPWLDPYYPDFSRLNFLTNISEQQARLETRRVKRALTRLKYSRRSRADKRLCEALIRYHSKRIHDGVHGWKLRTLSTQRKLLRIEEAQKKGFLRR